MSAQLHLLGLIAAAVGLVVLLARLAPKTSPGDLIACWVFGVTSMLVFGVSTIYHFMNDGIGISKKLENRMEDLDHFAIFLFIAGTYTPFILNTMAGPWQKALLWLIWSIAAGGITYTIFRPRLPAWAQHRFVNTAIFVLMGWTLVVRIGEAFRNISSAGFYFLLAGAASYSIGAVIYAIKRPNPFPGFFGFHEIWHIMVLMGFGFHYLMVLDFYR